MTYAGWDPNRHQWAEEWYPSGDYLFCYVEKTAYVAETEHTRVPDDAIPGYGAYTDIWLLKRDGSQAWQLTNLPNNYDNGVIHGAISLDGLKFAWSQRVMAPQLFDLNLAAGSYEIKYADFSLTPTPAFSGIQTFKPGGIEATNELEGISNDHTYITFYSTFESKNLVATPIYSINTLTGAISKLTTESFSQTPTFTPSGNKIVYMTGQNCDIFPFEVQGADWWMMNTNGSNKLRVTKMNVANDPQSVNHYRLAGSLSFVTDSIFYGGVMSNPYGLTGYTVKVKILSTIGADANPEFYIFPNPATDLISVHLYNIKEDEEIRVYNVIGKLMMTKTVGELSLLDVSTFPKGMYFISLKRKPKISVKFIKQ